MSLVKGEAEKNARIFYEMAEGQQGSYEWIMFNLGRAIYWLLKEILWELKNK